MSNDEIVDLGDWAEDAFSSACSKAGVTRNKSSQDRSGWDYVVQFPAKTVAHLPTDMQPGEKSARVQVKSKEQGKPQVDLSLSNALKFAQEAKPCFVVLYVATEKAEPVHVFAKHFWADEIYRTLKRVREAEAAGKTDFHKMSLSLTFGEEDQHDDGLLLWMQHTIEKFGEGYISEKQRLQRSVGYEEGMLHGSISFKANDLGKIVDHQIGLRHTAPLEKIEFRNRRFGIDAELPFSGFKPDFAQILSVPQPARVRVRNANKDTLWLDGGLHLPAIPNLPVEHRKMRVVAGALELIIHGDKSGTATINWEQEKKLSLEQISEMLFLARSAMEGPVEIEVRAKGYPNLPINVELPSEANGEALQQLENVITCLRLVADEAEVEALAISIDEIDQSWNDIDVFNGMVTGSDMGGSFELAEVPPQTEWSAKSISFYGYVDIGDWTIMAVVRRPITQFEMGSDTGKFAAGAPKVVEALIRTGQGESYLSDLRALYDTATKEDKVAGSIEMFSGNYCALNEADGKGVVSIQQK